MADVFISYSHRDRAMVDRLERAFERERISVFRDTKLHLGPQWDKEIEDELEHASCVVVVWSHTSVASDEVLDEANYAKESGKLIPVRIDDAKLPYRHGRPNYLDLRLHSGRIDSRGLRRLLDEVRQRMGPVNEPDGQFALAREQEETLRLTKLRAEISAAKRALKDTQYAGKVMDVRPLIQSDVRYELAHSSYDLPIAKSNIEARYRGAPKEHLQLALVALEYEWDRNRTK